MAGWFLDIFVVYLFKAVLRLVRTWRSERWPLERATVRRSVVVGHGGFGCTCTEVQYTYKIDDALHSGTDEKPFLISTFAEDFTSKFRPGRNIAIRVKPQDPEVSVLRFEDQRRAE